MLAPAFWAVYRGVNDPRIPQITIVYYAYFYLAPGYFAGGAEILQTSFSLSGPAQLTRENYIEVRWSPMIGLTNVRITANFYPTLYYDSDGASCGFRDEGQFQTFTGA